jgi:3-deoxy-manno-octulosonate cytidylyltransferase (CMP-KDO synthetase)
VKAVGVIPARYGSTRFPGKPLAPILGRPMIWHVYQRVSLCDFLDRVLVATDDERIAGVVREFGGEAAVTSVEHRCGTDRVAEAARGLDAEIVVNVQGDEPLIEPDMIREVVEPLRHDPSIPIATLVREFEDHLDPEDPSLVKAVLTRDGFALYFSRWPIASSRFSPGAAVRGGVLPNTAGSSRPHRAYRHLGIYAYRAHALSLFSSFGPSPLELAEDLEQLRALENGLAMKAVVTEQTTVGVDRPGDIGAVEARLGELRGEGSLPPGRNELR